MNTLRFLKHSQLSDKLHIWQFQQYIQDIPIDGARIIIRAGTGMRPYSISGVYLRNITINNTEKISIAMARQAAIASVNEQENKATIDCTKVLLPMGAGINHTYRCMVDTSRGPFLIYIDAENGKVVKRSYLRHSVAGER